MLLKSWRVRVAGMVAFILHYGDRHYTCLAGAGWCWQVLAGAGKL